MGRGYKLHLAIMYTLEAMACILWIFVAFNGFPLIPTLAAITYTQLAAIWHVVAYLAYIVEKLEKHT